jgi:Tfp pilus assembly protein PilO
VTLTDRDRKVLVFLVPVLVLMAYWFLLLAPQREEASRAAEEVAAQQDRRDTAQAKLDAAENAKQDFSADYTQIVRLGKAIPATVDMPSLIVQLDSAAEGTDITFTKIKTGERVDSATAVPSAPPGGAAPGTTPPADPATPAAAGGEQAQSAPGGAVEAANNTAQTGNDQAAAADSQTSTSSGSGMPVGGGSAVPGPAGAAPAAPAGLETVPLELEFTGNFFNLADFFHDVKRFVDVANADVVVSGRLLTIEGVRWTSDPEIFPKIRAEMKATIYLSPKAQGATAGATPAGPSTTTPATIAPATTAPAESAPEPAVAPTAAATP